MKKRTSLLIFLVFFTFWGFAQSNKDSILVLLKNKGFQNISTTEKNGSLFLSIENGAYRWTPNALYQAIESAKNNISVYDTVIIIYNHKQISLFELNFKNKNFKDSLYILNNTSFSKLKHKWNDKSTGEIQNSSFGKFDLIIYPHVRVQIGNFDNPIETQLGIAPMLTTSLWKGMTANLQMTLLFRDDMQGSENRILYPGIMSLNQIIRFPYQIYGSLTAGFFPIYRFGQIRHQYGLDVYMRKNFFEGDFYVSCNAGYTGFASFANKKLDYWAMNLFTGSVTTAFCYRPIDLWLKASYGRFLYEDVGLRFDLDRNFKELQFGLFVLKTENGSAGGFNFKIPIFPRKYFNPSWFRIKPAQTFDWEFRVNTAKNCGFKYNTGSDLDGILNNSTPSFIKKQIINLTK